MKKKKKKVTYIIEDMSTGKEWHYDNFDTCVQAWQAKWQKNNPNGFRDTELKLYAIWKEKDGKREGIVFD